MLLRQLKHRYPEDKSDMSNVHNSERIENSLHSWRLWNKKSERLRILKLANQVNNGITIMSNYLHKLKCILRVNFYAHYWNHTLRPNVLNETTLTNFLIKLIRYKTVNPKKNAQKEACDNKKKRFNSPFLKSRQNEDAQADLLILKWQRNVVI